MKLDDHPTVKTLRARRQVDGDPDLRSLKADELLTIAREAGADDAGLVAIDRPELAGERPHLERALPGVRTLLAYVVRMNREPLRATARSVANLEFHTVGHDVDAVGHRVVAALEARGVRALNPAMGFPMEVQDFPSRLWIVEHKTTAVAAGLGAMGIHRNVIHPRFGNHVLLGTVLVAQDVATQSEPLDYNPCLECKLCVSACPVGAIKPDGAFDFSACYHHNYHDFMANFARWEDRLADARSASDLRDRHREGESVAHWQSLSYGANYRAAYCLAVCPAGEDVIAPFLDDRKGYRQQVVDPLRDHDEPVYALAGSDAEAHVTRRFPHKEVRHVESGLRPQSISNFAEGLALVFQAEQAKGVDATWHFTFSGTDDRALTVRVERGRLDVREGLHGDADLRIRADAETWIDFLNGRRGLLRSWITGRIRFHGSPRWLLRFARLFPV